MACRQILCAKTPWKKRLLLTCTAFWIFILLQVQASLFLSYAGRALPTTVLCAPGRENHSVAELEPPPPPFADVRVSPKAGYFSSYPLRTTDPDAFAGVPDGFAHRSLVQTWTEMELLQAGLPALMPLPKALFRSNPHRYVCLWQHGSSLLRSLSEQALGLRGRASMARFANKTSLWVRETPNVLRDPALFRSVCPLDSPLVTLLASVNRDIQYPETGDDESFRLTIDEAGIAIIAESSTGLSYALNTLIQLIMRSPDSQFAIVPVIRIADAPSFSWRGLMIDPARHFIPMETLLPLLDGLEVARVNSLHLHLSDDQGFRAESRAHPLLHTKSSDGKYYSQAQLKKLVELAAERGIRVVPEFDMPGHATAMVHAYPFLSNDRPSPTEPLREWWTNHNAMEPNNETVFQWIEQFLDDVVPIFPSKVFHIGGDEVSPRNWEIARKKSGLTNVQLHLSFNKRLSQMLTQRGKAMVGWDEIMNDNLPKDTVVQVWRSENDIPKIVSRGFGTIASTHFYLNLVGPLRQLYEANLDLSNRSNFLGIEACVWAEYIDGNFDQVLWPIILPVAERMWNRQNSSVVSMMRRLVSIDGQIRLLGIPYHSVLDVGLQALYESPNTTVQTRVPSKDLPRWNHSEVTRAHRMGSNFRPTRPALHRTLLTIVSGLRPVSRTGRHPDPSNAYIPSTTFYDLIRSVHIDMVALASLCRAVVSEQFSNVPRVELLRTHLLRFANLTDEFQVPDVVGALDVLDLRVVCKHLKAGASAAIAFVDCRGCMGPHVQALTNVPKAVPSSDRLADQMILEFNVVLLEHLLGK